MFDLLAIHDKHRPSTLVRYFRYATFMILCCRSLPGLAAPDPDTESRVQHLEQQLQVQQQQIDTLKQQIEEGKRSKEQQHPPGKALDIQGFFDVNAQSADNGKHPFDLGGLELDIQYDQVTNFAVSTALVWTGDTSEVAVAVLDYHAYSHDVPTRGNLFGIPGYHIQFGRFDIPFGVDYEYFAAPDRPNITAPMTTQRIENDGLNGDGARVYGSWSQFDYAMYWTNSLFADNGSSVGIRLGYFPHRDPFRIHDRDAENNFILGLSWLRDMNNHNQLRNTLYALDMSWKHDIYEVILEYVSLDNENDDLLPGNVASGSADEHGYNSRLLLDFAPLSLYFGYGTWNPDYSATQDPEDPAVNYAVDKLHRLTLGTRYIFDDYFLVKLEYMSHMNTSTQEPDFERHRVTFQMVASF